MDQIASLKIALGGHIRNLRKEAGYRSASSLAEQLGVEPQTLYDLEQGATWLSPEMAVNLMRVFKKPLNALFPGDPSLGESQRALGELVEAILEVPADQRQLLLLAFKSEKGLLASLKDHKQG